MKEDFVHKLSKNLLEEFDSLVEAIEEYITRRAKKELSVKKT
jgi:hypothetical protein